MNFTEYQEKARTYAVYQDRDYPLLGLAEETGEFLGLFAKLVRGDDMVARFGSTDAFIGAVKKEAGDILWMLAAALGEAGIDLQDVATINLEKLEDRQKRAVLQGSGDNR